MIVSNEVDTLKKVIIHHPDDGIEVITPKNALKFLYDDIVYLPLMRKEHDVFKKVLSFFLGDTNVLDTYALFQEALAMDIPREKEKLIDYIANEENIDDELIDSLKKMSTNSLAYTLFTGIDKKTGDLLLPPLPNYVFTRDIGVVINNFIFICNASKKARTRESIITRFIIYFHPIFKHFQKNNDEKIIDMTKKGEDCTIEGGDVMMLDENHLIVGCSERSTPEAFNILKEELFSKNVVKHIIRVVIAKNRSSMHIDTLFTQVSKNEFIIYEDTLNSDIVKITKYSINNTKKEYSTFKDFFKDYNPNMSFILCGNGLATHAEREQWTDACNVVCLKDGVAIAYDRNSHTAKALENAGYEILAAEKLLNSNLKKEDINKTIISIESTELSRARGGPHCMTFPISRS